MICLNTNRKMNTRPDKGIYYQPRGGFRGRGRGYYPPGPPTYSGQGGPRPGYYQPRGPKPSYQPENNFSRPYAGHQSNNRYQTPAGSQEQQHQATQQDQQGQDHTVAQPQGGQLPPQQEAEGRQLTKVASPPQQYVEAAYKGLNRNGWNGNADQEDSSSGREAAKPPEDWRRIGHQGRPQFWEHKNAWSNFRQPANGSFYVFISRSTDEDHVVTQMMDRLWGPREQSERMSYHRNKREVSPKKRKPTLPEGPIKNKKGTPLGEVKPKEKEKVEDIILPDKPLSSEEKPKGRQKSGEKTMPGDQTVKETPQDAHRALGAPEEDPFVSSFTQRLKQNTLRLNIPTRSQDPPMEGDQNDAAPA